VQSISKDGPLELCLGDFVTLSVANTSGYHYQWKREGIPVGSDLNEFTATDAGTYSLIVSNVSGCFANSSNVINVSNVNSQLISTFKVNGPTSFCQGGNVELSVTNNPLFTYQWQKDGTDIAEATTNAYTAQYSGTYALYVRNSDGCRNKTEDVNVIVSNLPVAPLITSGGPLVFCQDDSVILSVTNTPGYIYHWKHNDNSTGSNLNSYAAKSAGTYSLVVSNAAGCTVNSLNSLNVSVNTKPGVPAVNISGPTSFCQGGNVLLSVVNNADCKYQWQKDGSDIPDATTNSYSAKNEGDYSLNVINLSGCTSKTDKVNLNVFAVPDAQTISSAGPLELCLGDSTILSVTGTAGYTYQWKRNGQHIGSNLNSFAAKTSGTYSLVISNSSGCSVNTANTIDISDANSQLTTTFKVSGSTSFCQGNSVEMSVSANPEYKYQWQKDGANINGATDHLYSASDSGIYCLNVINSKGCKNKTEDVKVIVFNSPAAPLILTEGSVQLCQGDSVILSVTNTPGYSYQWKLNSGAVGSDSINYIAKVSGTYTLTVSNSIECSASSINSVPVTVNPLPVIGTISQIGNDTKFCRGENITLSVPQNGTYKYSWMNRSVYIPDAALNTFTAGESGEYTVEVTSDAGCRIIPEPVKIEVVEMPSMPAIDKGTYFPKMCLGENLLKFSVKDSVSGYNYKWYRNGTPYSSAKSILIQDEGRYYLEAKIDICTSPYDSLIVDFQDDILPKPDIYARGSTIWYLTTSADAKYYSWSFNGKIIPGADKKYYVANQDLGVYRVGVSKDKECFTFSDTLRIIAGTTGIEDEDIFKDIKIYPNPTTGLITIVMENNTCGELNIDVMKQNGSIIMNHKFEKNSGFFSGVLDLSGSSSGIYLLRISIQNNITTRKIILK
jgi:predicted secreted protein